MIRRSLPDEGPTALPEGAEQGALRRGKRKHPKRRPCAGSHFPQGSLPFYPSARLSAGAAVPKYMSETREGAMIAEYYDAPRDHSVVFVGDCEVYESYSPVVLYREYGISSYIRGSAQQLIWQSYYLMEDTLRYETPEVFVFNIQSVQYDLPQKEEYNRMTLDGMRLSGTKLAAVRASMLEEESLVSYLFPILRYHERITDLSGEDLRYLFRRDRVTYGGYLMNTGVDPFTSPEFSLPLSDYTLGENAMSYLDKMVALCKERGVQLVFVKAPSVAVTWYPQWEEQIEAYAAEKGIPYYNFLDKTEEIGLDFSTDTYDRGQHLNLSGAEKLSRYFGKILKETCSLPDSREDETLRTYYEELGKAYDREKAAGGTQD